MINLLKIFIIINYLNWLSHWVDLNFHDKISVYQEILIIIKFNKQSNSY